MKKYKKCELISVVGSHGVLCIREYRRIYIRVGKKKLADLEGTFEGAQGKYFMALEDPLTFRGD